MSGRQRVTCRRPRGEAVSPDDRSWQPIVRDHAASRSASHCRPAIRRAHKRGSWHRSDSAMPRPRRKSRFCHNGDRDSRRHAVSSSRPQSSLSLWIPRRSLATFWSFAMSWFFFRDAGRLRTPPPWLQSGAEMGSKSCPIVTSPGHHDAASVPSRFESASGKRPVKAAPKMVNDVVNARLRHRGL